VQEVSHKKEDIMYTILGATGNVGKKIAEALVAKGEKVRLVARSGERLRPLVGKYAEAFVGDILDTEFLTRAVIGANAVFTLIPPNYKAENFLSYADQAGESIARALHAAKITHAVNLSSVGGELPSGTGPITGLHRQEERLNRIKGLKVLHLRAAYFMENLLGGIELIKTKGINGSAVRGDLRMPMIATRDIAAVAADRLMKRGSISTSVTTSLLGPRDLTLAEATMTIGIKIGLPNLQYVTFPYAEAEKGLIAAGLSPDMSRLYVEMSRAFNEGRIVVKREEGTSTPTTLDEFCTTVFVPAYTQKKAA
jgi:uncharacterized protein YbjT (DUF2867 family)